MKLKELIKGLNIVEFEGDMEIEIESIAYDSRKAKEGSVFVCIEGFKVDGHKYIPQAIENGTRAFIVQKEVEMPAGMSVVRVEDTRYALASISDIFFGHPSGKFNLIGITGTKGKTTTTYMIKSILENYGQKVGLIGTIANMIGDEVLPTDRTTPESYDLQELFCDMVQKNVKSVVMEVSSHALELHRVSCSEYDIGVFTNLSRDHLDFHKTFENYLEAKIKLFGICKKGLINIDNEFGKRVVENARCEVYTMGIDNEADIRAVDIAHHPNSVDFKVISPWFEGKISVSIPGKFSVYNALAAIGSCALMGVPFEYIQKGLAGVRVPGRAEIVDVGKDYTVMIDYAHSPDSLENILTTVKAYAPGRVVCVFGCGGDRDKTKRPVMGRISGQLADFTIITSDNPRTEDPEMIINDIEEGIKETGAAYIKIVDRREAIKYALMNARDKDIIVLAGKGHENYIILKDKTIHFDEREVIREILNES
ncbi:MAG TPA: UDP-N-acetylmuramoyl-L-alanyl-D-glutamate--2,6-diaminopimelate ligase [Acetivibrio sp.]|jgi:UDP-N-acetylmuramoyl-L-alanyl-D-glutamate--2,6-diaminopimelate ligase|nr:UDP-N-acetylmuramoyl-L-alanyl-D-glutamate--2,6-diaminopimelate ligase [Clostridium sp.]HOQ36431.1 UDP-N-acetylmuramoyl-L-alanyl-D-glutamate--2,6-diaminopimelate ligase [Acetivibrio sp.]HQA58806.1 UDP-N-acetylmuramoyl-L-alanyl-D-glutamate--2,6-diaminopimelate ligase [Acetivibrio sp.]